jgi:hypothetical protein
MPDWATNRARVIHPDPEVIDAIVEEMNEDRPRLLQLLRPIPEDVEEADQRQWYIDNWSTKWDIRVDDDMGPTCIRDWPHLVDLRFKTAWGPPVALYEHLVNEGGFSVMATFDDTTGDMTGYWHDGLHHVYQFGHFFNKLNELEKPQYRLPPRT